MAGAGRATGAGGACAAPPATKVQRRGDGVCGADVTPHAWRRACGGDLRWHFRRGSEFYYAKYSRKGLTRFFLVTAYGILGCAGMVVKQRRVDGGERMKTLGEFVGGGGV